MRPKRVYEDYLRDILDATQKAKRFVEGISFDAFAANDEKVFAVIRALEIIEETAKKIPRSILKHCPEVPSAALSGESRWARSLPETVIPLHSTVTLLAKFRGWSTSQPLRTATW